MLRVQQKAPPCEAGRGLGWVGTYPPKDFSLRYALFEMTWWFLMGYAPFLRKEVPSPFRAVDPDPPVGGQDDTVIIFIGKVLHFLSWSGLFRMT